MVERSTSKSVENRELIPDNLIYIVHSRLKFEEETINLVIIERDFSRCNVKPRGTDIEQFVRKGLSFR